MRVEYVRTLGPEWMTGCMRATVGKDMKKVKIPTLGTWRRMLVSAGGVPHSPIRAVMYRVYVYDVKSWVTVHYVRHHIGFMPYVKSQRNDRTEDLMSRDELPQGALIDMMFDVNANALLNIAKARLCMKASKDTRELMQLLKSKMLEGDTYDQELGALMQPPCKWYNRCYEPQPCGKYKRGEHNALKDICNGQLSINYDSLQK